MKVVVYRCKKTMASEEERVDFNSKMAAIMSGNKDRIYDRAWQKTNQGRETYI